MSGPATTLAALAWLAGCWEGRSDGRLVEEQWMAARGGTMLGMARTLAGDRLVTHEFTRIEARADALVYVAAPAGQPVAEFRAVRVEPGRVVFENLAHDFPQRVIYARAADGALAARIEGRLDGVERAFDYPMRRVACPAGSAP